LLAPHGNTYIKKNNEKSMWSKLGWNPVGLGKKAKREFAVDFEGFGIKITITQPGFVEKKAAVCLQRGLWRHTNFPRCSFYKSKKSP
jgi:hypothetical protein